MAGQAFHARAPRGQARATSMPDTVWAVSRSLPDCSRGRSSPRFWCHPILFRHVIGGSLAFAFLADTCRSSTCDFSATLTTPALDRRSSRWFDASPCRATSEDLPPSLA
jgi:hypothetical protein